MSAPIFKKLTPISFGSGDTFLFYDVLHPSTNIFNHVLQEVQWKEMRHRGGPVPRDISIQGQITIDSITGEKIEPVYRHPVDEQPTLEPWTKNVEKIKNEIGELLHQKLNHALIQLYRNGRDFIGEHSDKTLDIAKGSPIINYSLGASRTMLLKNKESGEIQRLTLKHNLLLVMGWRTNREWLHEIEKDKRSNYKKRPDEVACNGQRISLTFRTIATFKNLSTGKLYGQGARQNNQHLNEFKQQRLMLNAFSAENKTGRKFDWNYHYGRGFNVIDCALLNEKNNNLSNKINVNNINNYCDINKISIDVKKMNINTDETSKTNITDKNNNEINEKNVKSWAQLFH